MPLYETNFITRQDITIQDVEKLTELFSKIIADNGGSVVMVEQWGLRDFAYPIKKYSKGFYTLLGIDASNEAVKEMERRMKLNEDVLRTVTFRVDEISQESSPISIAGMDTNDDEASGIVIEEIEIEEESK